MENWETEKENDVRREWLCLHSNLVFMENGFLEREHHRAHGGITFRVRKASCTDNLFRGIRTGASPENLSLTSFLPLERITGIEPASSAWEADVLPMNYICNMAYHTTIFPKCKQWA